MNKPDRNPEGRYLTVEQVMNQTNLCRSTVVRIAKEADSIRRIGRAVRINADRFFTFFDKEYKD